jgi:two-component system sensor histidine kinase KdpD
MINHDLRNPVAAMQAAIETASIDHDYNGNQFIEDLKSSLSLQNTLISSLLDMASLGKSIDDYDIEDTYPIDLVQQCTRRQQMNPLGKNRELEINVPDTLPAVRCDPVQMGRVFDNLVSNALKYSDHTVEITANINESKNQIEFNVTDQGSGIPETERTRIFEPFERINETTRPIEGLGLGLAICRSIVEAHSGNITHTNNTNHRGKTKGSIFTITLPLA